jgi:hypothetical protein
VRVFFVAWPLQGSCVRDECSYQLLARKIVQGQGLQPQQAPLHPYLMGLFGTVFGEPYAVKSLQVVLSTATVGLIGWLGARLDVRIGRASAWIAAFHPTMAFFAATLWSESVFSFLIVASMASVLRAREGSVRWASLTGFLLGLTFLTRGIAVPLPWLYLGALLWPETGTWQASWVRLCRPALAMMVATAVTVAPYSIKASVEHGGLILSDATVGQQFFFGNNDFEPLTFDYGNGIYSDFAIHNLRRRGRPQCPRDLGVVAWNRCETRNGLAFIAEDPGLFLQRVPLRWAQLLNPHTFLTRHARWGRFVGMPWWLKEALCLWVLVYSFGLLWAGPVGLWRRGRGALGAFTTSLALFYLAVIAVFFGISRLRLPVEPFLIIWAAAWLIEREQDVATWRRLGALLTWLALVPLTLWFLPHGLPIPH